ncbi:MAG TPA: hypothetical protein VKR52_03420 [Terracidiphilus sp.]|nr:hypothetical protein [Terracidiphilus sp.]
MNIDESMPVVPTPDLVSDACKKFDEANDVVEQALTDLFNRYPRNDKQSNVLLKVVALNRLYSTNIFAVYDVAHHIWQLSEDVDSALASGVPEIVDKIARVTITTTGKNRTNYSFATKYCSWHNQASYPIWDSRVDRYLRSMRQTSFAKFLNPHGDLWNCYPEFVKLMTDFRDFYGLGSFNFKQIDKFLYAHGVKPSGMAAPTD